MQESISRVRRIHSGGLLTIVTTTAARLYLRRRTGKMLQKNGSVRFHKPGSKRCKRKTEESHTVAMAVDHLKPLWMTPARICLMRRWAARLKRLDRWGNDSFPGKHLRKSQNRHPKACRSFSYPAFSASTGRIIFCFDIYFLWPMMVAKHRTPRILRY